MNYSIRIIEKPSELYAVEKLQQLIWTGSDLEIVPLNMLYAAIHNGGLVIGAYLEEPHPPEAILVGFVFGFPGIYHTPDGPRLKHASHMLGVHPEHRSQGLGYLLKRAQWQMVRRQGIDRITWTYDPLLSLNAQLNITKLGAVCNCYHVDFYGEMRDDLNAGLPTDRFEVDWWVNSRRVNRRLSKRARPNLGLEQVQAAGATLVNPTQVKNGLVCPTEAEPSISNRQESLLLVEIPHNFFALKKQDPELALAWRIHSRKIFMEAFSAGYLITDFIGHTPYESEERPARSFYILSHGDSTL